MNAPGGVLIGVETFITLGGAHKEIADTAPNKIFSKVGMISGPN